MGFVGTLFVTWFFSNSAIAKEENESESRLQSLTKFTKIIGTIERNYVDEITITEVVNKAIDGLLSNLDAHSSFLDNKKFKELKIQTEGEFGGLGITVAMKDGALTVIAPIEGTPADKAGLQSGDIILKIENKSTLNVTIDEAVGLMRGKPKTEINLTIVRKNEPKPFEVKIIRDIIKIDSVYTKRVENEEINLWLESMKEKYQSKDLCITQRTRSGNVVSEIIKASEDPDVKLIVMGYKGVSKIGSFKLGSVSGEVAKLAKKPVLVVK